MEVVLLAFQIEHFLLLRQNLSKLNSEWLQNLTKFGVEIILIKQNKMIQAIN